MQELVNLIKGSGSLSEVERQALLETVKHIPEAKRLQLKKILEAEQAKVKKIKDSFAGELSDVNKKHLQELAEFMKTEKVKTMKFDEELEKSKADQVLSNI